MVEQLIYVQQVVGSNPTIPTNFKREWDEVVINLTFTAMIEILKKATRWYFHKATETYAWMPSGMLPYDPSL